MTSAAIAEPEEKVSGQVGHYSPEAGLRSKTIVIGAGPAGIRFAHELLKREPLAKVQVFGNEPYQPYNRVQLSALLAGEIEYDAIQSKLPDESLHQGFSFEICAVKSILTDKNQIEDSYGNFHSYDNLIIATGARPHIPNIPGNEQQGVYTFRSLKDTEFLFSRVARARHIVVVGGGLLGLEAAKALLRFNTKVTLVQQGARLMNRQLDDPAASLLQQRVEELGVEVITNSGVREILGDGRVTGVVTRDKQTVECDTVLVCAGIKPNKEIARNAKIKIANGIVVDDHLRTSISNIYAIGECSEHQGQTYGLVNPGYEQAAICADIIAGGDSRYVGSLAISRLKVIGESVCSMGEVSDVHQRPQLKEITYRDKKNHIHRKLTIYKGKLVGALSFGDWKELQRIQETYQNNRRIWPWQQFWFYLTGNVYFGEGGNSDVSKWPLESIICQCNSISHGELVDAMDKGYTQAKTLSEFTGAATVCGSCKPLLEQLTGNSGPREKEKTWVPTLIFSFFALLIIAFIASIPGLTPADSVQSIGTLEKIWNDKFYKQVTGFTLLGLSALGLLMSLRKKLAKKKLGHFAYWRLFHIVLGVLCASILMLHTGLHFGENFNRILMIDFIAVISFGAVAAGILSLSHYFKSTTAIRLRRFWSWVHILITWPLPILLGTHILTVYYF